MILQMEENYIDKKSDNLGVKKEMVKSEKGYNELKNVHTVLDKETMYAATGAHGQILGLSAKLKKALKVKGKQLDNFIQNILTDDFDERERLSAILRKTSIKPWTGEFEIAKLSEKQSVFFEIKIIPTYFKNIEKRFLILFTDISKRILAQNENQNIAEQRFNQEIAQQKINLSQIVNAQEEERGRIARDIHDGVGQMLTALKFNLESLVIGNSKNIESKVGELQDLTADIIKEVRAITFNLTPPELTDHGILSGIKKMTTLMRKMVDMDIRYVQNERKVVRFEPEEEINLYRIVQEGLNNAIKYSNANIIVVQINITDQMLSIKIEDDGKGFLKDMQNKEDVLIGKGLENMHERAKFIGARVFLRSSIGVGTTVTINMPIL